MINNAISEPHWGVLVCQAFAFFLVRIACRVRPVSRPPHPGIAPATPLADGPDSYTPIRRNLW